ncbi:hypothetical protein EYZ11_000829 [Aspergillus tanneri]|uniref:Cyclohexanone monooxygenase n=1 Tax=Aspergillus tanneri TaxID=1220188 RepID=A0A4S3JW29_9EURO|nr:uncharacterized protein ATNIH1004_003157 [Aspergillus tanneri]KAA8650471.1 hypothetical protein ATNIH1004_003157 [Aspergillus tanneri]THC99668.1 hypothetical protein EYZ11_000829 [Aspergillus tanneri]
MPQEQHLDVLVVGTGFSGIYTLHSMLQQGLTTKAIDSAPDVGGTWYWNSYPGAMSDTWNHMYRYTFDDELLRTYPLSQWFATQPEILEYLRHVVERHRLRPHMQFQTEMTSATWDDHAGVWRVQCQTGDVFVVRYLVTALGLLHRAYLPDIPGASSFQGEIVHSAAWRPELTVENKRVGVIGVGSTGVQIVTAVASQVQSLHVFIRRPQYSVPSGNRPMTPEERQDIVNRYPQIMREARTSFIAMGFPEPSRTLMSLAPDDREKLLEDLWQGGNGMRFMFGGFADAITDAAACEVISEFLRKKIASIVRDPQKRAVLTPRELFARRPLCDSGYYEQYNRENVFAVDAQTHPIVEITPRGIRTADDTEYELDVIIFATGFDAMDGSYNRIEIRGRDGQLLRDKWQQGPISYLGIGISGFPNLFMLNGPNGGFVNVPPLTETNVEFVRDLVRHAETVSRRRGRRCDIEPTGESEDAWTQLARSSVDATLFPRVPQWLTGRNVPGKSKVVPFYFGGLARLRAKLAEVQTRGYEGFKGLEEDLTRL